MNNTMKFKETIGEINKLFKFGKRNSESFFINLINDNNKNSLDEIIKLVKRYSICKYCNSIKENNICLNESIISNKLVLIESLNSFISLYEKIPRNFKHFVLADFTLNSNDKNIDQLISFIKNNEINEIVFILKNDIKSKLKMKIIIEETSKVSNNIIYSELATGIPFNSSATYFDEKTIKESLLKREKIKNEN